MCVCVGGCVFVFLLGCCVCACMCFLSRARDQRVFSETIQSKAKLRWVYLCMALYIMSVKERLGSHADYRRQWVT